MPDRSSKKKLPVDMNRRAKAVVDQATSLSDGATEDTEQIDAKSAAALLGRLGGLKGGKARAEKLTQKQRSAIAKKAAEARWHDQENG